MIAGGTKLCIDIYWELNGRLFRPLSCPPKYLPRGAPNGCKYIKAIHRFVFFSPVGKFAQRTSGLIPTICGLFLFLWFVDDFLVYRASSRCEWHAKKLNDKLSPKWCYSLKNNSILQHMLLWFCIVFIYIQIIGGLPHIRPCCQSVIRLCGAVIEQSLFIELIFLWPFKILKSFD